ncbi:MAG: hypothetical protein M1812_000972 [Candelaria pacifica]|nr:MAG: hypothetical protein M1812_000972 [Candelaria pacifica]
MATIQRQEPPGDVVEKVLRRAEVSKMARLLQNRLALATCKTKHGWENYALNVIESEVENQLKRKRSTSSGDTLSDSDSDVSESQSSAVRHSSSPTTIPFFSDDLHRNHHSGQGKQDVYRHSFQHIASNSHKRVRSSSALAPKTKSSHPSWKSAHHLPESSPVYHRQHSHYPVSHGANLSFVSETSTIPDALRRTHFGKDSDEDDDLPLHSFQVSSSQIHSSPPRTPPPTRARSARMFKANNLGSPESRHVNVGKEGADLLLYLASSPSPANPGMRARGFEPSTPPPRYPGLPSSIMTTPGGFSSFMGGFGLPNTPSQAFNFADFVNITPSPAQGGWGGRTPATAKTPLAAREARRRLNFDARVPATGGSPSIGNTPRATGTKETGLGMELGGELVS